MLAVGLVTDPIHIISLGAGVQSSTMVLMAMLSILLPMPFAAIFADTQREPLSVYLWLKFLCGVEVKFKPDGRPYVEPGIYRGGMIGHIIPVHIVTAGDLGADALRVRQRKDGKGSWVPSGIPHYSLNADGTNGHGPRQCTHDFKIIPIEREQRRILGKPKMLEWRRLHKNALRAISEHNHALALWKRRKKEGFDEPAPERPDAAWDECQKDALVVVWIGISTDEASRAKPSRTPWAVSRWPHLERGTNRDGCDEWMKANGFPKAPKSACEFCPYHDDDEWIRLRDDEPQSFERAVSFDYAYRAAKIKTVSLKGFQPFIHASRLPLDKVKFQKSHGKQFTMFNNECEGMCGV